MARTSLADRARKHSASPANMSIVEFAESPQGLGQKLFPVQKFFMKVFEKEDLDETDAYIPIRDQFNENELFRVTERGYYKLLRAEGRFTLDYEDYQANDIVQINLCMGRRASKTTITGVWLAYKLYQILNIFHPQQHFRIMKRDPMNITMTALGQDNADKLFKRFIALLQGSPFFQRYLLDEPSNSQIRIWTQYDLAQITDPTKPPPQSNSINVTSAANTPGVRGENNIFIVGDEFAHFNKGAGSTRDKPLDMAIYEALTPSTSGFSTYDPETGQKRAFGKSLFLSSPNGPGGKFWEDYQDALRLGYKSGTLGIQCPTWEVNELVAPAFLRKEYNKNPASYDQEYGGKFVLGGMNWITDLPTFYASVDTTLDPLQAIGRRDRTYFLGVDFALSNDGTACTISHYEPFYEETPGKFSKEALGFWEDHRLRDIAFLTQLDPDFASRPSVDHEGDAIPLLSRIDRQRLADFKAHARLDDVQYLASLARPAGRYVVDYSEVRYAGKPPYAHRKTLLIDDVLDWVEDLYFRWPIKFGCFDQWSGEIITQMVEKRGLAKRFECVKFTETTNDSMYKLFSTLLHQHELKFPNDPELLKELLALKVELRPHGMIKVEVPASVGHDDRFDSLARSIFLAYASHNNNYVLAGDSLQNLFNNISPVRTTGDFSGVTDERLHRKLQETYHQTGQSIRNPSARANGFKALGRARRG